jgi:hypothetical protein
MSTQHASVRGKKRIMWFERGKPNPVNYASNCATITDHQKHHILPCTSVGRSVADAAKNKEHFDKALKYFTKWNINDSHNLMPLPTRTAYQKLFGKRGGKQNVTATLGNLPCHQPTSWGHTDYNDEVKADVAKVWGQIAITIDGHKLNANDLSGALTILENKWKTSLQTGRVGTIAKWRDMAKGVPGAHNNFTMIYMATSPFA